MRLIDEIAYQEKIAKIPIEERTFVKAWETAQDMPMIDAAPVVRGEWMKVDQVYVKCFFCEKHYYNSAREYSYCPNCGAKMDGKHEKL